MFGRGASIAMEKQIFLSSKHSYLWEIYTIKNDEEDILRIVIFQYPIETNSFGKLGA
jgi:hypothetical protein